MGTRALPGMYALSPRALGIHIRQSTRAHVTTITYYLLTDLRFLTVVTNFFSHGT